MPSDTILNAYLRKIEREWKKQGARILKEVARVTKLEWREKEIVIYITAGVYPYSDPMTLNPRSSIHTLSHELIHRILSEPENREKIKKNWAKLMKKYKGEVQKTKTHIIIHAIHAPILKKLFGENVLNKEKKEIPDPRYLRSWEIVDRDGYKKILEELTQGLQ